MAAYIRQAPPRWLVLVAFLLLLFGAAGLFAFYRDATMNETRLATMSEFDRNFFVSRPGWFIWVYGAAVWAGFFGALALMLRRRVARPLYIVSLIAVVVQFGWVFAVTDLIAAKGAATVLPFPLVILGVTLLGVWLSTRGIRRGWLR
ncbi:hypothetical protein COC42_14445 [Sphingomonas spermidinifaciens]|uniref:Sugar transporter n=1 Tax=Sphingomonas spermidinifaciens TaxID=1141889 RepID=A0A2A4B3H5_9SPHN|nr:hypothetical protein [Sphingomonas spermidinifaciens]PCD02597.1 hypothetical protein COC42_14445 [Sphingomonas spermidinifaciens]